ncbi:MAG TPA: ribonuclease P protein component [Synergistaceae bacterium]|nr:ribonuclease P protein component [Synergistaceae bacterium]
MNFGFSSAVRLRHGWQFDLVFRTGRRETGELVRLLFVESAGGPTQIGVTVGRKIANAAKRSRGRRTMRESFRRLLPWIKDEVWIVASLRESGLEKSSKDVYKDIARSLKRRGLMRPDWPGLDWDADKDVKPCA